MNRSVSMAVVGLVGLAAGYVLATQSVPVGDAVSAQSPEARFAAVPGEKGGQDIWGAYEPVPDWPKDIATLPGHEGWTFGAGQSVFAESPDRVFVLQRGELPNIPEPQARLLPEIGPSIQFPVANRIPWRSATVMSPPGAGGTGQVAERGMEIWAERGLRMGVDARWEHLIMIFDREGNMVESWTQYDEMMQRPHFVAISPYDPEKHVWIVDDHKHVIHKFTNDGELVQTIGTYGVPGDDESHFNRPAFMDWFPDGSFVVSDGYNGTRVVKMDRDGNYLMSWGERGTPPETRPGYFNNVHGIAVDPKTRRVFVNDRNNGRVQVFDENGTYLDEWSFGPRPISDVHMFHIFGDGYLWAADRGTSKIVKYDLDGNFMYAWGTWGIFPGGMWGVHGMSVDSEGNFYVTEVDRGGVQKLRPRPGANPAFLVGGAPGTTSN